MGRLVADRLNRTFLDADLELEVRAGRPISAIFAECGEAVFRDWEERTLAELTSGFPDAIVATGGGAVLRQPNRSRIRDFGFVIWLTADPAVLARRLASDPAGLIARPPLTPAGTIAEITADAGSAHTAVPRTVGHGDRYHRQEPSRSGELRGRALGGPGPALI